MSWSILCALISSSRCCRAAAAKSRRAHMTDLAEPSSRRFPLPSPPPPARSPGPSIILETMLRSKSAARTCRNASSGMATYVTRKPELYFIVFGDPFRNVPAFLFLFLSLYLSSFFFTYRHICITKNRRFYGRDPRSRTRPRDTCSSRTLFRILQD